VLIKGNTQLLFGGMGRLSENCVLNIKNKSHAVTAEIEVPKSGAEGVIIAQGANIGGWSLYAKGGKLKYCYNVAGVNHYFVESADPLPAGDHQVRMEFAYAGGGLGKGGQATLFVDGKKVGEGAIPMTQAMVFSAGRRRGYRRSRFPRLRLARQRVQRPSEGRPACHCRGRRELGPSRLAGGRHPHRDGAPVRRALARQLRDWQWPVYVDFVEKLLDRGAAR
jgi:hypothetical protein